MGRKMIKNTIIFMIFLVMLGINSNSASAITDSCNLDATLINQDPYPAISGSYVEVLFQINGVGGNCENGAFARLMQEYPFSLDAGDYTRSIKSNTYVIYTTLTTYILCT